MTRLAVCAVVAGVLAGWTSAGARAGTAPQFTFASDQVVAGDFAGFGGQMNQHVYADLSGPPPDLPTLEAKVLALRPQFVRIFFNTTEWTYPDRMASFVRTVRLAQRAQSNIMITWQGSTFKVAQASMDRFAEVLTGLLDGGVDALWVNLFNEPNVGDVTLPQYEQVYRTLDASIRARGMRDRIHFMGGGLLSVPNQATWFTYMAERMGDLLDAWSIHVYWNYWEPEKIDRRLMTEVRTMFAAIPAPERRPVYVTEFGIRGYPLIQRSSNFQPGFWLNGTPMAQTTAAAFQEGWFMIRAAQLGFAGLVKWDLYNAKYDNGTQDFSTIGPGADGWLARPSYHLLRLLISTADPIGGSVVQVAPQPGASPTQLMAGYVSPMGGVTVWGLDTRAWDISTVSNAPIDYSIGGLPPSTVFHLLVWNGDGSGTNVDFGPLDSGPDGTLAFTVPLNGIFALTTASAAG
jgi:hypothetical protein